MKRYIIYAAAFLLVAACKSTNDNVEPQAPVLNLTMEAATKDGNAIQPLPDYALTLKFDLEGNPTSYESSGSEPIRPSVGVSGTWSISGTTVTFTDDNETQTVTNTAANIDKTTTSVTLSWELDKTEVELSKVGLYSYRLKLRE